MAQFESIPDDILLEEILPSLPVDDLSRLCSTSRRLHDLCQVDAMWARRVRLNYPDYVAKKPANVTWQDYYFQAPQYRDIPIWMNRQIVDTEWFHPSNPIPSRHLVDDYVSRYPNLLILYTTKGLAPIYSVIYENGRLIQSHRYGIPSNQIGRIILSNDPDVIHVFIEQPIPVSTLTRIGRGRQRQETPEQAIQRYHDKRDRELRTEIGSLLSTYGIIYQRPNAELQFSIIRRDVNQPIPTDRRQHLIGRNCLTIPRNELTQLIREFGSDVSEADLAAMNRAALCQHIQDILEERGLIVDTTDDPMLPNPYITRYRQ